LFFGPTRRGRRKAEKKKEKEQKKKTGGPGLSGRAKGKNQNGSFPPRFFSTGTGLKRINFFPFFPLREKKKNWLKKKGGGNAEKNARRFAGQALKASNIDDPILTNQRGKFSRKSLGEVSGGGVKISDHPPQFNSFLGAVGLGGVHRQKKKNMGDQKVRAHVCI